MIYNRECSRVVIGTLSEIESKVADYVEESYPNHEVMIDEIETDSQYPKLNRIDIWLYLRNKDTNDEYRQKVFLIDGNLLDADGYRHLMWNK